MATACGRDPAQITVIAVSKRQPFPSLLQAYEVGVRHFGENTAQGFKDRQVAFAREGVSDVFLHFIGALQTNKVKAVAPGAYAIHSLDRMKLLNAIEKCRLERPTDVYIQVNLGEEPQKSGVAPEEAIEFAHAVAKSEFVRLKGLMTLPPVGEQAEPYFHKLSQLGERVRPMCEKQRVELSMGMTADFESAIKCGSTCLRIGTGIFGQRV